MLASEVQKAAKIWPSISEILFVPHTDREYQALVGLLDSLIDEVGEDETHSLASLMEVVGVLVEKYGCQAKNIDPRFPAWRHTVIPACFLYENGKTMLEKQALAEPIPSFRHAFGRNPATQRSASAAGLDSRLKHAGMTIGLSGRIGIYCLTPNWV